MKIQHYIKSLNIFHILNIVGLAVGLTCFIYIALYIAHELKFDKFHDNTERIYRVNHHINYENSGENSASAPYPLAENLRNDFRDEIEEVVQFFNEFNAKYLITVNNNHSFYENDFVFVDSNLFSVFDFTFLMGNPKTALNGPNKVILTETKAKKLFGKENAVGQTIKINNNINAEVTGIVKDMPSVSHFSFGYYCSMATFIASKPPPFYFNWHSNPYWTYIKLNGGVEDRVISNQLDAFTKAHAPGNMHSFSLQPLTSIYLNSNLLYEIGKTRKASFLWVLGIIGVLVLAISLINYVNIVVSTYQQRTKGILIRKLIGANPGRLIAQMISEITFTWAMAFLISVSVIIVLIQKSEEIINTQLSYQYIIDNKMILVFTIFTLLIFCISAVYPSLIILSKNPIHLLSKKNTDVGERLFSKKVTVVFQLLFSIFLISCSLSIVKQLNYFNNKSLGFSKEGLVIINLKNTEVKNRVNEFLLSLDEIPGIKDKTSMEFLFGYDYNTFNFRPEGKSQSLFPFIRVNHDFLKTFDIELLAGRDFSRDNTTDDTKSVIINEAMCKHLGWEPEEALGKRFTFQSGEKVIGVIHDYHIESLHNEIRPLVIDLANNDQLRFASFYAALKIDMTSFSNTIGQVEKKWNNLSGNAPFSFNFLDDTQQNLYVTENKMSKLVIAFTIISVLLTLLGILSLSIKLATQKTKEIGVRKVNGAKAVQILTLINKEFIFWCIIAFIINFPLSWFVIRVWQQNFAYQTKISWWIFILSGLSVLISATLTVSFQSFKTARRNPIEALRYE